MDQMSIEGPCKAFIDLENAMDKGQGVTFTYTDLLPLALFTFSNQPPEAEFEAIFEKATKSIHGKHNLTLTAGEANKWFGFLKRLQQSQVEIVNCKLRNGLSQKENPFCCSDFMSLVSKLAKGSALKSGIALDESDRTHLLKICDWYQGKGDVVPLENNDPAHPLITAMEKLHRPTQFSLNLDPDEVDFMDRLVQQFNGYSRPGMLENNKEPTASKQKPAAVPNVQSAKPTPSNQKVQAPLSSKNTHQGLRAASGSARQASTSSDATITKLDRDAILDIDKRMESMVAGQLPGLVSSVIKNRCPVGRWIIPLEEAFRDLEGRCDKSEKEAEDLRSVILEDEKEYEKQLESARNDHANLAHNSNQNVMKLESDLRVVNDLLSKQVTNNEKRFEERLQAERDSRERVKKEGEDRLAKVEAELQVANSKIERAKTAFLKQKAQFDLKLQSSKAEISSWEGKFNTEAAKNNVLRLDYDATLQEIGELKLERARIEEQESKWSALESELAVLRSSRTNPQVEKDNIAKAVRNALANQAQTGSTKLEGELRDTKALLAKQMLYSDQCEVLIRERDGDIATLKGQLSTTENTLLETSADLEEARRQSSPDAAILRELDEEQMKNQHLEDRLHSVSALLRELTVQLEQA